MIKISRRGRPVGSKNKPKTSTAKVAMPDEICIANLNLSGEGMRVGFCSSNNVSDPTLWVQSSVMVEPCYMSLAGVDLLIASLQAARSAAVSNGAW